jgi:type II secretory pathway pseudopilin PulG
MKQKKDNIFDRNFKNLGFTLLELTISIFIMVLVSTISIANFRRGERSRATAAAFDTVVNAVRNAQNFTLTSRVIANSTCVIGGAADHAPQSYLMVFSSTFTLSLYGVDKCSRTNLIESYPLPPNTKIMTNGYKLNTGAGLNPVTELQIKYTPPFAKNSVSTSTTLNGGAFTSYSQATITVGYKDASISKIVTVDGLSGRVGE